MKDVINEIKKIAKFYGVEPSHLTPMQFFSKAEVTEWDVRKLGGFNKVKDTFFPRRLPDPDKSLVDSIRKPKKFVFKADNLNAVAVGDLHLPWCDSRAVNIILEDVVKNPPEYFIQLGDIYDFLLFTGFRKGLLNSMQEKELVTAYTMKNEFWKRVKQAAPKAKCFQLKGNHDDRLIKRIQEKMPELEYLMQIPEVFNPKKLFEYEGVQVLEDESDELIIGNTAFIHSGLKKGDNHRRLGLNVVHGHTHKAHIDYTRYNGKILFEADAAYLGDPSAVCFKYKRRKKLHDWIRGYLRMDEDGIRHKILEPK